jgi:hypothetical protein
MIEELQQQLRELAFLLIASHQDKLPEFTIDLNRGQYLRLQREMNQYFFSSSHMMAISDEPREALTGTQPIKLMIPPNVQVTFKLKAE